MINTLAKSALALVLATAGYFTTDHYAPAWTAELRGIVQESGSNWSEAAIRSDPVGYLEFTRRRLEGQKGALSEVVRQIRNNMQPLQEHIQQRTEEQAKTEAFLKEGRSVYQDALKVQESRPVEAIKFAGRIYPDLPTFKAQIELLFNEKQGNEALLKQARETKTRLDERLYAMLLQQGKLEMAIQEIGPQIAIVQAEVTTRQLDEIMQHTHKVSDSVLTDTTRMIDEFGPIGVTKDLVESAKGVLTHGSGFNGDFERFLTSSDV
jgi:gas vesicle protein